MTRAYILSSAVREATGIQARVRRAPNPPSPIPGVIVTSDPRDVADLASGAVVYASALTPTVRQAVQARGLTLKPAYELLRDCGATRVEAQP